MTSEKIILFKKTVFLKSDGHSRSLPPIDDHGRRSKHGRSNSSRLSGRRSSSRASNSSYSSRLSRSAEGYRTPGPVGRRAPGRSGIPVPVSKSRNHTKRDHSFDRHTTSTRSRHQLTRTTSEGQTRLPPIKRHR